MDIKILASSSKGNCTVISDGSTSLLLDCGLSIREIKHGLGYGLSQIAACLLSHAHADHARAAKDIVKAGIDLYTSPETINALSLTGHRVKPVKPMERFQIGTWRGLAFDAVHDVPNLGFLLQSSAGGYKVLYLVDSAYCKYRFAGLTHILVGCNYSLDMLRENVAGGVLPVELKNRIIRSHMSLQTAMDFLRANDLSKVWEIWLLHLSKDNANKAEFKSTIQKTTGKPVFVGV